MGYDHWKTTEPDDDRDWRRGFDPMTDCDEFPEGAAAFRDARPVTANPYPRHTTEHVLWRDGWEWALERADKVRDAD